MSTRAARAREAALIESSKGDSQTTAAPVSKTPQTNGGFDPKPKLRKDRVKVDGMPKGNASTKREMQSVKSGKKEPVDNDRGVRGNEPALVTPSAKDITTLKRGAAAKKAGVVNGQAVTGGWLELPHNMGKAARGGDDAALPNVTVKASDPQSRRGGGRKASTACVHASGQPPKKDTRKKARSENSVKPEVFMENVPAIGSQDLTKRASRRKVSGIANMSGDADPVAQEIKKETPAQKRGARPRKLVKSEDDHSDFEAENLQKKKRATPVKTIDTSSDVKAKLGVLLDAAGESKKTAKKEKKNPYGLTPGISPFTYFTMPTPEACMYVHDKLTALHGEVKAPEKLPVPSTEVSGCGEVPSVLDAMIRTLLSAATTSANSSRAFQGLVTRYGLLQDGIGKGSVNWNAVRESDVSDVFEAIKSGGLAKTKSQRIKEILDMVYTQNLERRNAFVAEKVTGGNRSEALPGSTDITPGQKDMEIAKSNSSVLSLDHIHAMSAEDAMVELVKFPGIGVKTASCVILFCMQRPSFAVDTHVWRLCKWLKWVPEGATRDQTFSHCDVHIPDELKYGLHQLFIRHGKTCGRCRAATSEGAEGWDGVVCPIEDLVERTGKRKGGVVKGLPTRKRRMGKSKYDVDSDEEVDDAPETEDDERFLKDDTEDADGRTEEDDEDGNVDD